MRSSNPRRAASTLASLAGLALILSACSETTAPTSLRSGGGGPLFTIGPTANVGPVQVTLASSAATQFCSAGTVTHGYTIPASYAPLAGCGTAVDLQSALGVYNPGWSTNLTGSSWIGPVLASGTSNEYKANPGTYVFQTTFSIPAGVTNPVLNDTLKSDNAVAVYLNGHKVEQQVISDCVSNPCNWVGAFVISDANAADFVIGGTNTVTVLLVDTPNGGTPGNNYACIFPPQTTGSHGFTGDNAVPTSPAHVVANWTATMTATSGCENPTGLDFHGTVSWVVPVILQWCSPGFWKNHLDAWSTANQNKLYSTLVGAAPLKAGSPSNPTLLQVVSNPQIFGGPATVSVANYLSGIAFGSSVGTSADDSNCNDGVLLTGPIS